MDPTFASEHNIQLEKTIHALEAKLREKNLENEQLKETMKEERERFRIEMANSYDFYK